MAQENNPTGAKTLSEANVNPEFSSQSNVLASMEGDVKTHGVLINEDSPSGTLDRKQSSSKRENIDSSDGFQRFDNQEVSGIGINYCTFYIYLYIYFNMGYRVLIEIVRLKKVVFDTFQTSMINICECLYF